MGDGFESDSPCEFASEGAAITTFLPIIISITVGVGTLLISFVSMRHKATADEAADLRERYRIIENDLARCQSTTESLKTQLQDLRDTNLTLMKRLLELK